MAHPSALAVVAQAVTSLLSESRLQGDLRLSEFTLISCAALSAPSSTDPPSVPGLGVTVFPHRVSYSAQRRPTAARTNSVGERFRPSVLVDLHLLVSAWATSAAQQMHLLGWAARTIEDTPILGAGFLNRFGSAEEPVFDANETIEVVPEPLSMQDLVSIWELNKARQQPSLGYVARMIALDSDVRLPDTGIVRSRVFDHGLKQEYGDASPRARS